MNTQTPNFMKIENEQLKNLVFFFGVILISFVAILFSSISLGLVNTLRFYITSPDMENLRDSAVNLIKTSNIWNLINEALRGVLIVFLIKLANRFFNKSKLSVKELGLTFEIKQLWLFFAGIALMSLLFLGSLFINVNGQAVSGSLRVTFSQESVFLLILIAIANAFWQEVVFRGYFQKRLIDSYGVLTGIILCAFLFTAMHGFARDINLMEVMLGTVLFTLIGLIYYLSNSILLVTAMHATGNFFLRSFGTNNLFIPEQEFRLFVFSIVLIIILLIFRKRIFSNSHSLNNNFG